MNSNIHFILGGARSGKSKRAQELAQASGLEVVFVATYIETGLDFEMQKRIKQHQKNRPKDWPTIEDRFDLLNIFEENGKKLVLADCLTLWLSRQMRVNHSEKKILGELETALKHPPSKLLIVSNEVGLGLVPDTVIGREFRDMVGRAHQLVAHYAQKVEFMIAGLPLQVKT